MKQEVRDTIQRSYSEFLKAKNLKPRFGQKLMIAAIAKSLADLKLDGHGVRSEGNHVCVVEAGTGTGKTVAYLLAAIPIARALGKKVVVSTATVALQEQIVFKDLPDLKRSTSLDFQYGLAKGRGRYLCLSKLDRLLADNDHGGSIPLFQIDEATADVSKSEKALYQSMMQRLASHQWEGDKDDWPEEIDSLAWSRVTNDHRQCTGRRCQFIRQCAFYRSRDALAEMDCVVANHDLVLADLALGGGAILPPPEDTLYVFDEGHHLPEKALNHFSAHTRLVSTSRWLGMSEGQWSGIVDTVADATYFKKLAEPVESELKACRDELDTLQPLLVPFMEQMDRTAQTVRYRFPEGQVPEEIEDKAHALSSLFSTLLGSLEKCVREVEALLESDHSPAPKDALDNVFSVLGGWIARVEANVALWNSYAVTQPDKQSPRARWLTLLEFEGMVDFELVSSPILAANTLTAHLWERCFAAVVTSASLTALGVFDRFKLRSGSPETATYEVVPSPFDFNKNAVLRIPSFSVDGNKVQEHTQSIIDELANILEDDPSALVLFSSRKQMNQVYDELGRDLRNVILMQGNESKQVIINKHKARIDQDKKSVLFGLASFAEGLDLPGKYCEHVVIAKIPFAVPDDPVEAAMAEWLEANGGNPFMQIAVPDAAVKLLQACGRLLRTETDTGTITVLDRRLVSKRYGAAILKSLPPFRLELP